MQDDIFYGIFAINRDRASIIKTYKLCGISAVEREGDSACIPQIYLVVFFAV